MVSIPNHSAEATGECLAETETIHSVLYQPRCSSWPVACSGSQVISPANFYPRHDVSCIYPSSSRVSRWIDRSLQFPMASILWWHPHLLSPYSSFYCAFSSAADFRIPPFTLLRPLMHRIIRTFGSQPWIDALLLLVMAISWLGKAGLYACDFIVR